MVETITMDIVHTRSHILLTCIYRPHATNVEFVKPELDTLLDVSKSNRNIYMVVGDFNIDLLKMHYHSPTSAFCNIMVAHGLTPTITKPTRISEFSHSLIDNIFLNTMKFRCKATIFWSHLSDNFPVMLELADMKEFLPNTDYKQGIYDTSSITKFTPAR